MPIFPEGGSTAFTPAVHRGAFCSTWIRASARRMATGRQRLEQSLRMHALSPALRLQPGRRSGAMPLAAWQRSQRRRLGGRPEAGRGALQGQGVAHLFPRRRLYFRADAGFANPEICECLEAQGIKHAIRFARQDRSFANAASGKAAEPHSSIIGELPLSVGKLHKAAPGRRQSRVASRRTRSRVGFIVTNMARVAEKVVGFYDKRGTCDQGGQTLDQMDAAVTPFVCTQRSSSLASCARLQSRQFPSHPRDAGADQGMVADKPEGKPKVVSHGRYVAFQLGPRWPFREICSADALRMISELRPPPVASTR